MSALLFAGLAPRAALAAFCLGFLLDLLLGDPAWLPHPVVAMGRVISAWEPRLRALFASTPAGQRAAGRLLAAGLPLTVWGLSWAVCRLAAALHPLAGLAVQAVWCGQCLALKGLREESEAVRRALCAHDLPAARAAVGRIVGRDTAALSEAGVTRAAVETVAENLSDGVIAPMLYLALGGAPLGLAYKAVNTMDSMVGYKTERYLWFGRAAAHLDDAANWLPSRLSALLLVAAAFFCGQNAPAAWRIWRRDRRRHASPNSAQTESACAGALGVQLAGPASYFGQPVQKPTIGDAARPIEPEDIHRAHRLLYTASILAFCLCAGIKLAITL